MQIIRLEKDHMPAVIDLLQDISTFTPEKDAFDSIWNDFSKQNNVHSFVLVNDQSVIGYGSIIIETKIRGGKMGHIEDIVTHSNYRGQGLGKHLMEFLLSFAKEQHCYKVALQCKAHNTGFYSNCGLTESGIAMQHFC
jgi:glucosamine-phosphate N-acetyltransferase